jgi:hypothetical protein
MERKLHEKRLRFGRNVFGSRDSDFIGTAPQQGTSFISTSSLDFVELIVRQIQPSRPNSHLDEKS